MIVNNQKEPNKIPDEKEPVLSFTEVMRVLKQTRKEHSLRLFKSTPFRALFPTTASTRTFCDAATS